MVSRPLATKFSLAIALVVVVSVGAMSLLAVSMSRRSLRDQASAANHTAASLAARAIEQYLADAASIMREAPGRPKLSQEIRGGNWAEATKVLENFLRHFPQFDYVFVQDPQGVIRVRVPHTGTVGQDFSFREFFQEVMRTRALSISDVYISRAAERPVVSIAVPVLEGGETVKGVLVGALSLRTMSEVVSAIGKDDGVQLYLVDRKGVLIAQSNGGQAELRREDRTALPIAPAALADKAGAMEFTDPRTGESVLGSHVPIARLGWAVVATKPKAMAFAPADRLARWLVGVSAACAALAVVLGWRLARALTRPIARLATATDRLAAGDFDVRLSPEGRDEVASLTASFNHMAEQIKTSYRSLERKRKEVEAINEELVGEIAERRQAQEEVSRLNHALQQQLEELQRTQAQLVQSEKVATMGSLLAGVAHELNNPLAVVMGQADLLGAGAKDPALLQRAERINAAADRCARIVRNFLGLVRQRPAERTHMNLNQIVQEALELLAYDLRTSDVSITLELAEDLPVLWADAHQLHQVVINLMANAHQAMRHSATPRRIVITTRLHREPARVQLEVADTGPGIPAEIRTKIFEPFFTTKPPGEGTGLGLSLCKRTIEEHGGTITVESEPGHGTTFRVELPVLSRPAPAVDRIEVESLPAIGGKMILVVDDEPDIATTLAEALQSDGHRVAVATQGAMALEMLAQQSYDVVLSDSKMPGLDGVDFFRELVRRFPTLRQRVIFITGDILDREKQQFLESAEAPCLTKPFELREVRQLVRRILVGAHKV